MILLLKLTISQNPFLVNLT